MGPPAQQQYMYNVAMSTKWEPAYDEQKKNGPMTPDFTEKNVRKRLSRFPEPWHRASVWTTVRCKTVSSLLHVHFQFDGT